MARPEDLGDGAGGFGELRRMLALFALELAGGGGKELDTLRSIGCNRPVRIGYR